MPKQYDYSHFSFALLTLTAFVSGLAGYYFETGLPPVLMAIAGMFIGVLLSLILNLFIRLINQLLQLTSSKHNHALSSTLIALFAIKSIAFRWPDMIFYPALIAILCSFILFYHSINYLRRQGPQKQLLKYLSFLGIITPLLILSIGTYWLIQPGKDPFAKSLPPAFDENNQDQMAADLGDLSQAGTYKIDTFTYGSGKDSRRKEYAEAVKFKTAPVDASLLIPEWKEKKKKWREQFWKFGANNFPINGRVYMPQGDGPFPLILIVHGNHSMIDYSDDGYGYLARQLASRGFITVSVDENFINAHWSGDFRGKEMPVRAWLLLKHLAQWKKWNDDTDHEMANKIDLNQIILIGHSRGGEAVSIAAAYNQLDYFPDNAMVPFDFHFNIKGIVAIAPTDYRYHRKIKLKNINYLSLQGSYDIDESSFWGMRPYHRLEFTDSNYWFKAGVYIHKANHGQFNSTWGRADYGGTFQWLLNTQPILTAAEQQQTAKTFITAFAEAVCNNHLSYLSVFKNAAHGKAGLPNNYCLTHFSDTHTNALVDFEDDINPQSARNGISINTSNLKIWREETLKSRLSGSLDNNVAILGWDYGSQIKKDSLASYKITLPDSLSSKIDSAGSFTISIAAGNFKELEQKKKQKKNKQKAPKRKEPPLDFSILITDIAGQQIRTNIQQTKKIAPLLRSQFTKSKSVDKDMVGKDWEITLSSFHIPLLNFSNSQQPFNFKNIRSIELVFDQTAYGVIAIDDIGFDVK